jgi:hypothetical protein
MLGSSFAAYGQHKAHDMSTPAADTLQVLDRSEDESSNDLFSKSAEQWLYAEIEKVAAYTRFDDSSIGQAEQSCLPSGMLSRVKDLLPAAVDKPTQSSPAGEDFSAGDNITAANDRSLAGAGVKTINTLNLLHTNTGGLHPPPPGHVVQDGTSLPPKSSLNGITVVNNGDATSLPPKSSLDGITVVNSGAAGEQYPRDSADGGCEGKGWGRDNQSARGLGDMGKTAEPDCFLSGRKREGEKELERETRFFSFPLAPSGNARSSSSITCTCPDRQSADDVYYW